MHGFTLIELLLVVAILAMVAGGVLLAFEDAESNVEDQVARAEMAEIVRALRAFKADLGAWPRQGLFALAAAGGRIDPAIATHWPPEVPPTRRAEWFEAPGNLYQLLARADDAWVVAVLEPVFGPGRVTDPDTGRGFRGPYLARSGERFVFVGPDLEISGDGDPAAGSASDYLCVAGIADPFRVPRHPSPLYRWEPALQAATETRALGRPYLLFLAGGLGPRLVCLGANGTYDSNATQINAVELGDDLCVCLEE